MLDTRPTIKRIKAMLRKEGFYMMDNNYKKYPLTKGKEYKSYLKFTMAKGNHFVVIMIYDIDYCKMAYIEGYETKSIAEFNSLEEFLAGYRKTMINWELHKKMSA